jgi:hypothetical protein
MGFSRPYRADRLYSSVPRLEAWAMFPWPFGPLSTLPALPACERIGYRLLAIDVLTRMSRRRTAKLDTRIETQAIFSQFYLRKWLREVELKELVVMGTPFCSLTRKRSSAYLSKSDRLL